MPSDTPPETKRDTLSGTYNLWIDAGKNPQMFEPGIRQRLGSFLLAGKSCLLSAEGPALTAALQLGAEGSRDLFRIPFTLPRTRRRHLITIGWSKGCMKVILDAKPIAEVPVTFMLWLAFVSGIVCPR